MNIPLFRRGRSERKERLNSKIPGLNVIVRLAKAFFDRIAGKQTKIQTIGGFDLTSIGSELINVDEQTLPDTEPLPPRKSVKGPQRSKELPLKRWRRRIWAFVKQVSFTPVIKVYPAVGKWRDLFGWRGPPRELNAAIPVVRLQE